MKVFLSDGLPEVDDAVGPETALSEAWFRGLNILASQVKIIMKGL